MSDDPGYFLTSDRLGFRRWAEDDLDLAHELWGDPEVMRLIDARGKLSRDRVKQRLVAEINTAAHCKVQYWPIFLIENDAFVGCCGLRPYDLSRGLYELGFHICSKHWRRGFASEAAHRVIAHAFDDLGVHGLFAGHNPKNDASRILLEKLGFRYTHAELYEPTGLHHPSYILRAEEYAKREC